MSTDLQKYSTENQANEIQKFADEHGISIVRTYADHGVSGLKERPGFTQLIADVENGVADFDLILVYDVSRWGRFQDIDKAGHYEYLCRKAGIPVVYCGEQFARDDSLGANVHKSIMRILASLHSKLLSQKVFIGQKNLIERGWRQGGSAGFGLRRLLIDQDGSSKGLLKRGERKSLQTDRVILVPGPKDEVEIVRWIYRVFVKDEMPEREIAARLNRRGVLTDLGRAWTRGTVHQVLINEKYIGNNVWNRHSFKLKEKHVRNSPDLWVRANEAFEAIVERDQFEVAQEIIRARSRRLSDEEMLIALRRLLEQHGYLSGLIIDEAEDAPSSSAYRSRFGDLVRAYRLIGFTPDRDYRYIEINRMLRDMHPEIVKETISGIEAAAGWVKQDPITQLLTVNGEFTTSLVIVRCRETKAGALRWHVRLDTGLAPDVTVAVRMAQGNQNRLDYYLLPWLDIDLRRLRLAEHNGVAFDAYRFETLDPLFELASRVNIDMVA